MTKDKIKKIAVIGDVHYLWNDYDVQALKFLDVDLVLFVGDFGNEALSVVEKIAEVDLPKAIVMGNHDAWFSATPWGRKKTPYDRNEEDWVQQQLDLLGDTHVGYGYLDFDELEISVVGSRPFSWGGSKWWCEEFYEQRYGITSFAESTEKIMQAVKQTKYDNIIFIGHNGPVGLGDKAEDTCGRDWQPLGGDYGDPDLAEAIDRTRELGKQVSLVTFGHMHHPLRHTKKRLRTIINRDDRHDTIYLNAAATPRIEDISGNNLHKFSIVELTNDGIINVELITIDEQMEIHNKQDLWKRSQSGLLI